MKTKVTRWERCCYILAKELAKKTDAAWASILDVAFDKTSENSELTEEDLANRLEVITGGELELGKTV